MGAIRIRSLLSYMLTFCWMVSGAQEISWTGLVEDTTYFAKDFQPDQSMVTLPGPAQTWDFRSLKAPYSINRRMVMNGERGGERTATIFHGLQTEAIVEISDNGMELVQVVEANPVCPDNRLIYTFSPAYKPFYGGVLGEQNTYSGKMVATFLWPRDMACQWAPRQLPDSCRITYTILEESIVDAEGILYLPTEIDKVNRQNVELKRALKIEVKNHNVWREVTSEIPGVRLISNRYFLRFISSTADIQLVEIELNAARQPIQIEFKTHPMITRVFTEEPTKPDIFAYPNPSYDIVRFQLTNLMPGRYALKIYNILGVPVKEVEVEVNRRRETLAVDLSAMQRGTYLFRLQDKTHRTIKTKRVVLIRS
jgi:hypothetical protein